MPRLVQREIYRGLLPMPRVVQGGIYKVYCPCLGWCKGDIKGVSPMPRVVGREIKEGYCPCLGWCRGTGGGIYMGQSVPYASPYMSQLLPNQWYSEIKFPSCGSAKCQEWPCTPH